MLVLRFVGVSCLVLVAEREKITSSLQRAVDCYKRLGLDIQRDGGAHITCLWLCKSCFVCLVGRISEYVRGERRCRIPWTKLNSSASAFALEFILYCIPLLLLFCEINSFCVVWLCVFLLLLLLLFLIQEHCYFYQLPQQQHQLQRQYHLMLRLSSTIVQFALRFPTWLAAVSGS